MLRAHTSDLHEFLACRTARIAFERMAQNCCQLPHIRDIVAQHPKILAPERNAPAICSTTL